MDYQGNYFPEEDDENASKTYLAVKKIFKFVMYGISFLIYGLIFILIFVNRDSKILEKNYMAHTSVLKDVETESIDMYEIHTKVFMNEDGSLQVHDVNYAEDYGIIEIGVKFNSKKLTNGDKGDCLDYVFTDSNGKTYELINAVQDNGGRYGFSRICFESVDLDLNSNNLRYEGDDKNRPDTSYTLSVIRKSDKKVLYDFIIYNNSTTFSRTEYED